MDKRNESKLWRLFKDNINDMLALADAMNIEHPYWTEQTAELMADAAIVIVKACELPQEEKAG